MRARSRRLTPPGRWTVDDGQWAQAEKGAVRSGASNSERSEGEGRLRRLADSTGRGRTRDGGWWTADDRWLTSERSNP